MGDLLADPAWDILLALFIAACEGRRKSAASACADAGVAESNALRWLSVLETQGLVVGRAETQSAREGFRSLSPATLAGMTDYFRHSCE